MIKSFPYIMINLFVAVLLLSCQQSPETSTSDEVLDMTFQTYELLDGDCADRNGPCFTFRVEYPVFTGPDKERLTHEFQEKLFTTLGDVNDEINLADMRIPEDLSTIANQFREVYRENRLEFPESKSLEIWTFDLSGSLLFKSEQYLTLEFNQFIYTGGAHGLESIFLSTIDREKRQFLTLNDLPVDQVVLAEVANATFREQKGLDSSSNLSEAGYFWISETEGQFQLPEGNFGLTDSAILLHYNPYEIAAYSEGSTRLIIPLSKLQNVEAGKSDR